MTRHVKLWDSISLQRERPTSATEKQRYQDYSSVKFLVPMHTLYRIYKNRSDNTFVGDYKFTNGSKGPNICPIITHFQSNFIVKRLKRSSLNSSILI